MADNNYPKFHAPPKCAAKVPRKRKGRKYTIYLGYGEEAKELWEQFEKVKERLGFRNLVETAEWMLKKTRPFVIDEEEELNAMVFTQAEWNKFKRSRSELPREESCSINSSISSTTRLALKKRLLIKHCTEDLSSSSRSKPSRESGTSDDDSIADAASVGIDQLLVEDDIVVVTPNST